jgi:hypothetical protein
VIKDALICCVFSAWFFLCILNQIVKDGALGRFDLLGIVPSWRLFAPKPHRWDYCLVRRTLNGNGIYSDWKVVPLALRLPAPFPSRPDTGSRKALSETVRRLQLLTVNPRSGESLDPGYLWLVDRVLEAADPSPTVALQFSVVAYRKFDPSFRPRVVLCSFVCAVKRYP